MIPNWPSVTFGIIVLNGEPFTRYCLRSLYPFAHQIIVVEGAAPSAKNIATPDGHSRDGTLDTLRRFKTDEDPDNKLIIVTAEDEGHPNGFWPGEKDEMSQAYAKRTTGNYLWQVDIDEFYKPEDMVSIVEHLEADRSIHAVSFKQIQFWGGFDFFFDSWRLRRGEQQFHRLFRWDEGHHYVTHRPPTIANASGKNLRDLGYLNASRLKPHPIYLYHYSFVFPTQVSDKCSYYALAFPDKLANLERWADEVYTHLRHPWSIDHCGTPSWLNRFVDPHPPIIQSMVRDLKTGRCTVPIRPTDDLDALCASKAYQISRVGLITLFKCDQARQFILHNLAKVYHAFRFF